MSKFPYEDIINLSRPESGRRTMTSADRAAQFSPFAAVVGHDAAVEETARITDRKIELDEYAKESVNNCLQTIFERINQKPEAGITYFVPDEKKEGGSYKTLTGHVKKIDEFKRVIILEDDMHILIDDILEIEVI